ncbi:MAG: dual specificity protein phosphatase family protein [Caldilineaceae bacterium]|nr:dual specificity protein phosphatase family protein [Caldilineaceae bacterium]
MSTTLTSTARPFPNCYWVKPGRLLAGEYPGARTQLEAQEKLALLLKLGITYYLDLTDPADGLEPYRHLLPTAYPGYARPVIYLRMAICDLSVPTPLQMTQILDEIDIALRIGHNVYVHCWGGVGRTGTVVGCHFVRHGMGGDEALNEVARLWQDVAKRDRHPHSPETPEQIEMVRSWREDPEGFRKAAEPVAPPLSFVRQYMSVQ